MQLYILHGYTSPTCSAVYWALVFTYGGSNALLSLPKYDYNSSKEIALSFLSIIFLTLVFPKLSLLADGGN